MPHSLIITFAMFIVRSFLERSDKRSTLVMVYKFNNIYLSRRNYIGIFCKSNYFSVFLSHVSLESTAIITIVFSAFHMLLCFKKSAKQQMQGKRKTKQNKTRQNKNRMEEIWKYLFVHCLFVSWRVTNLLEHKLHAYTQLWKKKAIWRLVKSQFCCSKLVFHLDN